LPRLFLSRKAWDASQLSMPLDICSGVDKHKGKSAR